MQPGLRKHLLETAAKTGKKSSQMHDLRRLAEAKLRKSKGKAKHEQKLPKSVTDLHRLLHELQVSRVELELQNAELVEARNRFEALAEKYVDLYEFSPVGHYSIDPAGQILELNLTGGLLLGLDRSNLVGRRLIEFIAPGNRASFKKLLQKVMASRGKKSCEITFLRADAVPFVADLHVATVNDHKGPEKWCRVAVSDVTGGTRSEEALARAASQSEAVLNANEEISRRREVEALLRESEERRRAILTETAELESKHHRFMRQLILAQEEDRKQISLALHDEVGQVLTGINVRLSTFPAEEDSELKKRISDAQELLVRSIGAIHQYARDLRPALLDDLGLNPALRSFIKEFSEQHAIKVHFSSVEAVDRLDSIRRTVLFRVAQEALTNVARHARARDAFVTLEKTADGIRLEIKDNGKGAANLSMDLTERRKHLGLLGMRERVEMVNGRFQIKSVAGRGTTVTVDIPRKNPKTPRTNGRNKNTARG